MPPWLQELLNERAQNPYGQQSANTQPAGVQGNSMAPIFTALAAYLSAQPGIQQQKLNLGRELGSGVMTNPHDMLYGRDNPAAIYNPNHDAYWRRTFGQR